MTYHQTKVEREGDAAKVRRREGQPRARHKMLDCCSSAVVVGLLDTMAADWDTSLPYVFGPIRTPHAQRNRTLPIDHLSQGTLVSLNIFLYL